MYALRERRQHVTQEDFEFAVAKVCLIGPIFVRDTQFVLFRFSRRTRKAILLSISCSPEFVLRVDTDCLGMYYIYLLTPTAVGLLKKAVCIYKRLGL